MVLEHIHTRHRGPNGIVKVLNEQSPSVTIDETDKPLLAYCFAGSCFTGLYSKTEIKNIIIIIIIIIIKGCYHRLYRRQFKWVMSVIRDLSIIILKNEQIKGKLLVFLFFFGNHKIWWRRLYTKVALRIAKMEMDWNFFPWVLENLSKLLTVCFPLEKNPLISPSSTALPRDIKNSHALAPVARSYSVYQAASKIKKNT